MAKIFGTSPSSMQGSVGNYTYRKTSDGVVVSEKISKGRRKTYLSQARARYQMANLTKLAALFFSAIEQGWEKDSKRTRNAFVRGNYGALPIYLTKQMVNRGCSVLVPCTLTEGTLVPLHTTLADSQAVSDVVVGNLSLETATIASLSEVIKSSNDGWADGDQLSVVFAKQFVEITPSGDWPTVVVNKYELTLGSSSQLVSEVIPNLAVVDGKLAYANDLVRAGVSFIHSRKNNGKIYTSVSNLVCVNAEIIDAYSSDAAIERAGESYGGIEKDPFLAPDTNTEFGPEPGPTTRTLTLTCNEEGGCNFTVNGSAYSGPISVDEGESLTVVATPASGYSWIKWSDNETAKQRTIVMEGDVELQAMVEES